MGRLRLLLGRGEIAEAVRRLAEQIGRDYGEASPLLIAILRGSFIFLADLVRQLTIPVTVDFLRVASYRSRDTMGRVRLLHGVRSRVQDRHVLVVEDIVDTGLTTRFILGYLRKKGPASLKLCTLLDKPARRQVPVTIDYLGFTVPDRYLVGYGLDLDQRYRQLPDISMLEEGDGPEAPHRRGAG
ncbi:MAG: hypoxanthine phosphoribosyltransferase [Dehalococcoidia bacterium]